MKWIYIIIILLAIGANIFAQSGLSRDNVLYPYQRNLNKNNFTTAEYIYELEISVNTGRNGSTKWESWSLYFDNSQECDKAVQYMKNANIPRVQKKGPIRNPNYGSPQNNNNIVSIVNENNIERINRENTTSKYFNQGEVQIIESPIISSNLTNSPVPKPRNRKQTNLDNQTPQKNDGLDRNSAIAIRNDYPVLPTAQGTSREEINKYQEERIKKREVELKHWTSIYESINNKQRLTTVLSQLIANNSGKMPTYVREMGNSYVFEDKENETVFFVRRDGCYIEQIKTESFKIKGNFSSSFVGAEIDKGVELSAEKKTKIWDFAQEAGKESPKWIDLKDTGIEIGAKGTTYSIASTQISIDNDGSAIKRTVIIDAPSIGVSGKLKIENIGVAVKASLVSADGSLTYISSPMLDLNASRDFMIDQKEYGVKIGASVGAGAKANFVGNKKETEISLIAKIGVQWESHDANKSFNQLPPEIIKKTYLSYLDDNTSIVPIQKQIGNSEVKSNLNMRIMVDEKNATEEKIDRLRSILSN